MMKNRNLLREIWDFLKVKKKYWLIPLIIMLILTAILIVFSVSSALSPFIYALGQPVNYIIEGNSVYFENSFAKLIVTPHTSASPIKDFSQEFELKNKRNAGGDLCVAYVFDEPLDKGRIWLEKEGIKEVSISNIVCSDYTCNITQTCQNCINQPYLKNQTYNYWDDVSSFIDIVNYNNKTAYYSTTPLHFSAYETRKWKVKYTPSANEPDNKWELYAWNTISGNCRNSFLNIGDRNFLLELDPWWSGNFSKCLDFYTANPYPKNYVHRITINSSVVTYADFKTLGADIRWAEGTCNDANTTAGELNHFIGVWDTGENSYLYFVNINANRTNISLYYKNPDAITTSNISNIGNFNDDFLGSVLDLTKWSVENGSCTGFPYIANSTMNFTCISNDIGEVYSTNTYGINHAVEVYLRAGNNTNIGWWDGAGTFGGDRRLSFSTYRNTTDDITRWASYSYSGGVTEEFHDLNLGVFDNGYRIFKIVRNGSIDRNDGNSTFWINNSIVARNSIAVPLDSLNAFFNNRFISTKPEISSSIEVGWVIVRNYTDPEPIWRIGEIQTLSFNLTINSPQNRTYNTTYVDFNITSSGILSFANFSIGNTNYTMAISGSKASYTNSSMNQGQYTARFWANDSNNQINNSKSVIFYVDSVKPNIVINSPTGTLNTLTFAVNITTTDAGINYCNFTISRGDAVEVANTEIPLCQNTTATVSSDANFVIHISANDTAGNINSTNSSFSVSTGVVGDGGGGGGIPYIAGIIPQFPKQKICEPLNIVLQENWEIIKTDKSLQPILKFLLALYDYLVCSSASSIIMF